MAPHCNRLETLYGPKTSRAFFQKRSAKLGAYPSGLDFCELWKGFYYNFKNGLNWWLTTFFQILLEETRGTENARRREGAPKSTRSHETAWNKLRKCQFFALQKNRLKSQPFTLFRPGPGPARPHISQTPAFRLFLSEFAAEIVFQAGNAFQKN